MAQSAAASPLLPPTQVDNRQSRLDAAIALFRSEASASGYVVEEVRLRLPVPDVDVMPRVVIAQQSASTTTPPTFPRAKHPRPLSSYASVTTPDHAASSRCDKPFSGSANYTKGKPLEGHVKPVTTSDTKSGHVPRTNAGFKRTVSGSVIFHPVPARALPSKRDLSNAGTNTSHPAPKMGPLSSIPYLPTKDSSQTVNGNITQKEQKKGAFWKTVIGSERGKAILRAAESMHRMRHGNNGPKFRSPVEEEDTSDMEVESPETTAAQSGDIVKKENEVAGTTDRGKVEEKPAENILHINGHNIPESHVQLLLSSAADISAREKASALQKLTASSDDKNMKAQDRKIAARPRETVNGKPSGAKAIPVSRGKQFSSKGRRDSSDRQHSRSSAARPFRCHKCPSSFDRDGHLRVHILAVHEKKRPFVCQVCDSSFGHSSSLLRHVRTVHNACPAVGSGRQNPPSRSGQKSTDSGTTKSDDLCEPMEDEYEKHFRCSACGQAFNRVALLNRHVASRHPLQSSSPEKSDDTRKSP